MQPEKLMKYITTHIKLHQHVIVHYESMVSTQI